MITLTTADGQTVDLTDMGPTHYDWGHATAHRIHRFGDGSYEVESIGAEPNRMRVIGEYLLSGAGAARFTAAHGIVGQKVSVSHGATSLGTALVDSLRVPRERLRDREAPLQRWEMALIFDAGASAPGAYVAVTPPVPIPAGEPPP